MTSCNPKPPPSISASPHKKEKIYFAKYFVKIHSRKKQQTIQEFPHTLPLRRFHYWIHFHIFTFSFRKKDFFFKGNSTFFITFSFFYDRKKKRKFLLWKKHRNFAWWKGARIMLCPCMKICMNCLGWINWFCEFKWKFWVKPWIHNYYSKDEALDTPKNHETLE